MRALVQSAWQLPLFLGLALAITWSVQIPVLVYAHGGGRSLTDEANVQHLFSPAQGELDPRPAAVLLPAPNRNSPRRSDQGRC